MPYILRRRKLGRTSCREIAAKSQTGLRTFRNDQPLPVDTLVFRWGCTSNVPGDATIVNSARAIHLATDKPAFRRLLQEKELCPETWFSREAVRFPAIVRPQFHHQGRQLYVVNTPAELDAAIARCGPGWYAAEVINKIAEYRVYVAQGRVPCVARKFPANPEAIAWNVFQGGRFENVRFNDWPLRAVRVSLEAFELSGLDFGGVDIMVDAEGRCYVLELNSAPSLTSNYRQTCFAKVFDYIVRQGKAKIPLMAERGGYLKFIHPAISERAVVPQEN